MTAEALPIRQSAPTIHPLWVRITHWVNALAILIMVGSGWQIYDASPLPLFDFTFPTTITLGGWLAAGIAWHLAGMWILVINGIVYVTLGLATGRFRTKLFPIRPREVARDLGAALRGRLSHDDLSAYNAVQKILYLGVICAGVVIVLTGLSIWKPVQFQELTYLFGGYDRARYVHFFAMSTIVGFLAVHIVLALIVPKSLRAMITGR
ncbi:MAG TPA: cytochrome b/b6 domain-containing protein [Xanthobacteraceae bacterium]|nr:cytochrome b/b6 domain-containing protein [Xanthobacteraceae bacterium]